jgi:hypothetical protein
MVLYDNPDFLGMVLCDNPDFLGMVHPILSNPLKYSSSKILYHDGEFLI